MLSFYHIKINYDFYFLNVSKNLVNYLNALLQNLAFCLIFVNFQRKNYIKPPKL